MPGLAARSRWLLATLAFAACFPALGAGFVGDDFRFVTGNPPVQELSAANVIRYFADPSSQAD